VFLTILGPRTNLFFFLVMRISTSQTQAFERFEQLEEEVEDYISGNEWEKADEALNEALADDRFNREVEVLQRYVWLRMRFLRKLRLWKHEQVSR
jgi:hypothetical protein